MKKKKLRDYNRSKTRPVAEGSKTIGPPIGRSALRSLRRGQLSYLPDYDAKVKKAGE